MVTYINNSIQNKTHPYVQNEKEGEKKYNKKKKKKNPQPYKIKMNVKRNILKKNLIFRIFVFESK